MSPINMCYSLAESNEVYGESGGDRYDVQRSDADVLRVRHGLYFFRRRAGILR